MVFYKPIYSAALGVILSLAVAGCSSSRPVVLDSADHDKKITDDLDSLYGDQPMADQKLQLSIDDAIDRALKYNLDTRVSAIENLIAQDNVSLAEIRALPNVTASGTFTSRNNDAASSSESILTGTQSLEPSTSSDPNRRLADIEAQWNIVDAVIAYLDGKSASDQALIAQERLKKVRQNVQIDTINAYWRAYAAQRAETNYRNLLTQGRSLHGDIETAYDERLIAANATNERQQALLDQLRNMSSLYDDQNLAGVELKSLMAMPVDMELDLISDPGHVMDRFGRYNDTSTDELVRTALVNRPELRELYLDGNVSAQNVEKEVIRSFPGLNLVYSKNYDSNSFLYKPTWINFSAALSQSLTDFLTLPTRYRAAQNQARLVDERRKALTAAIIAQVYLGRMRIDLAERNYDYAVKAETIAKRQAYSDMNQAALGRASDYTEFLSKAAAVEATTEKYVAFAELQRAYVDLYRTLGIDVYEEGRVS